VKAVFVDGILDLSQAVSAVVDQAVGTAVVDRAFDAGVFGPGNGTIALRLREAAVGIVQTYASIGAGGDALQLGAMDGLVDGVRVWGTAWSGRELQARAEAFAAASTPADAALVLDSRGSGAGRPPPTGGVTGGLGLLFEETFDAIPGGVLSSAAAPLTSEAALVTVSSPVAGPGGLALRLTATTAIDFFGGDAFNITDAGFTLQAWFRTSSGVSELGTLISKGTLNGRSVRVNSGQWALQWTPRGGLGFHVQLLCDTNLPGVFSANAGASFADGAWHHVVGTWDGSKSRVYVDGALKGASLASPCPSNNPCPFTLCVPDTLPSTLTKRTRLGRDFDGTVASYFDGEIDDLATFSAPLTAEEIAADYTMEGGRVNTKHAAFSVHYDFNALVDLGVPGTNVGPALTRAPVVLVALPQAATWTSSGSPVRSLAHLYEGRRACVNVSGADGDGDDVMLSVVTVPASSRAFVVHAPGCDPTTGEPAGIVGVEIVFAGQKLDKRGAVVFYLGAGKAF
jgi:hypothetical protein